MQVNLVDILAAETKLPRRIVAMVVRAQSAAILRAMRDGVEVRVHQLGVLRASVSEDTAAPLSRAAQCAVDDDDVLRDIGDEVLVVGAPAVRGRFRLTQRAKRVIRGEIPVPEARSAWRSEHARLERLAGGARPTQRAKVRAALRRIEREIEAVDEVLFLTAAELAGRLRVPRRIIKRLTRSGSIPSIDVDGQPRYNLEDVLDCLRRVPRQTA